MVIKEGIPPEFSRSKSGMDQVARNLTENQYVETDSPTEKNLLMYHINRLPGYKASYARAGGKFLVRKVKRED